MKLKSTITVLSIAALFSLLASSHPEAAQRPAAEITATGTYYLFTYFKDNEVAGGGAGMYLAWSADGLDWKQIGDAPFFKPSLTPILRDPDIKRGPDGVYRMVWTSGWDALSIGYAESDDLIHWRAERILKVMENEPAALNTWAPETFYDPENKRYMIFWSSTIPGRFPETDKTGDGGLNHRIYYTTTTDFKTLTPATLLYDPGFNCIDATIAASGGKYYMFLKNETLTPPAKYIIVAESEHPAGPYSKPSKQISSSITWAEGPAPLKAGNTWYVYYDQYTLGRYGLAASTDLKKWKDLTPKLHPPKGIRHGTAFSVDGKTLAELLSK